jgi:hypothetical protein
MNSFEKQFHVNELFKKKLIVAIFCNHDHLHCPDDLVNHIIETLDRVDSQGQVDIQLIKSHPGMTETVCDPVLLAIQIIFILVPLSALHVLKPQRPPKQADLPLPIHPMSGALVPARVIEQVVLVVPFGVVPLPEGCELGDDRPSLEAIDSIESFDQ